YWAISLALDAYGSPHMAYHDFKDGHLKYASKQGGTWTIENLDNSQFSGEYVSLAFGASGNPHIAYSYHYSQATNAELRYASRSGRKWTVETIDSLSLCCAGRDANVTVSTGMWTSLAIDASDKPHVAFWRYVDSDSDRTSSLIYATKGDNSWKLEILDSDKDVGSSGSVGQRASLALSADGNPRIAYYDVRDHELKYASKDGGNWAVETVTAPGSVESFRWYPSLAVDSKGSPHIAYYEMTEWMRQGDLKYASKTGASWNVEPVDSGGNVGEDLSLALNAEGEPRIAYHDHTKGCLKYAEKRGGDWIVEAVDCTALVTGTFTSLTLDAYGNPHVAYYDLTNVHVIYASAAVELNAPDANWKVGTSRNVTWQGTGLVDLFISKDGGNTWLPLASGLTGGSFNLQVPNLPTTSAKLKVERAAPYSKSTSGVFTIVP